MILAGAKASALVFMHFSFLILLLLVFLLSFFFPRLCVHSVLSAAVYFVKDVSTFGFSFRSTTFHSLVAKNDTLLLQKILTQAICFIVAFVIEL